MELLDTPGKRIVAARRDLGMKQVELAELIHVSERTMQAYESDDVTPYRKVRELSEVLNVSMAWILHGEAAEKPAGDLEPVLRGIAQDVAEIVKQLERKHALTP